MLLRIPIYFFIIHFMLHEITNVADFIATYGTKLATAHFPSVANKDNVPVHFNYPECDFVNNPERTIA